MKKLVIANFKCNKSIEESIAWLNEVGPQVPELPNMDVVVCPSFVCLDALHRVLSEKGYPIKLGAQSVSAFEKGAYTGEVSARMLSGLVEYVLVGHSERRSTFFESNDDMGKKVSLATQNALEPLLLIRGEEDTIPEGVTYFAWEPVNAIGTGSAIDAQTANDMVGHLAQGRSGLYGMYGGSVTPSNVKTYLQSPDLYGVVVGSASLDSSMFLEMLNALR